MTMREIAETLSLIGNEIKYTTRKDGGIRITYINGQRFSGSTGNTIARSMVGASISEARIKQLGKIKTPKGKWGHKKLDVIPEETKKEIARLQRLYKKRDIKGGAPTLRNYRYVLKSKGKEEANRLLGQSRLYAMGLAYDDNIDHLIARLKSDMSKVKDQSGLDSLIERLKSMKGVLKEKVLQVILDTSGPLYQWEMGTINTDEFVRQVNAILDKN